MVKYEARLHASGLFYVVEQVPPPVFWLPPQMWREWRYEPGSHHLAGASIVVGLDAATYTAMFYGTLNHPNMHLSQEPIEREIGGRVGWPPLNVVADDVAAEIRSLPETP